MRKGENMVTLEKLRLREVAETGCTDRLCRRFLEHPYERNAQGREDDRHQHAEPSPAVKRLFPRRCLHLVLLHVFQTHRLPLSQPIIHIRIRMRI